MVNDPNMDSRYTRRGSCEKWPIPNDFGLRSLVIYKLFHTETAASVIAHVQVYTGESRVQGVSCHRPRAHPRITRCRILVRRTALYFGVSLYASTHVFFVTVRQPSLFQTRFRGKVQSQSANAKTFFVWVLAHPHVPYYSSIFFFHTPPPHR